VNHGKYIPFSRLVKQTNIGYSSFFLSKGKRFHYS